MANALPLYNPPTRVADEMAMLDVMSGGRLIAGLVVGGHPEYYFLPWEQPDVAHEVGGFLAGAV